MIITTLNLAYSQKQYNLNTVNIKNPTVLEGNSYCKVLSVSFSGTYTDIVFSYIVPSSGGSNPWCFPTDIHIEDLTTGIHYPVIFSNKVPLCSIGQSFFEQPLVTHSVRFKNSNPNLQAINILSKNDTFVLYGIILAEEAKDMNNFKSKYIRALNEKLSPIKKQSSQEKASLSEKGEFETNEAYKKRIASVKFKLQIQEIEEHFQNNIMSSRKQVLEDLVKKHKNQIDWSSVNIAYNAENQVFDIDVKGLRRSIKLAIPISEAPEFKKNLEFVKFYDQKYQYWGRRIQLKEFKAKYNDKIYVWKNSLIEKNVGNIPLPKYRAPISSPTLSSTSISQKQQPQTKRVKPQNKLSQPNQKPKTRQRKDSLSVNSFGIGLILPINSIIGIGISVKGFISKNSALQGIIHPSSGFTIFRGRYIYKGLSEIGQFIPYGYGEVGLISVKDIGSTSLYGIGGGGEIFFNKSIALYSEVGYLGVFTKTLSSSYGGLQLAIGAHIYF